MCRVWRSYARRIDSGDRPIAGRGVVGAFGAQIAYGAVSAAMYDAGIETADTLYVGNMLSGNLLNQEHLGTLVADACGLYGIETAKVEAACASGAAALRVGVMAVASGFLEVVIVVGLEKMTDTVGQDTTAGLATGRRRRVRIAAWRQLRRP